MILKLFSHNQTAYEKIMDALSKSDRTCICHPTGTGKSYLIAATAENFDSVLILAPNIFVLNQVKEVTSWHKGIDYMTYQLLNVRGIEKHYDLIVLDEFHRAGAEEWGKSVCKALSQNGGKVLGTTATPIRYLDGERNMADEIFHGNIASEISIAEAWSKGILPIPTYVIGLYDFTKTAKETAHFIRLNKRMPKGEKKERLTRLSNIEMDWKQSGGMPAILRKHIDKDTKRIIVFCGSIQIMRHIKKTIGMWFDEAGLKVADIYSISSDITNNKNRKAMSRFEQDTDNGIKIMLSVNMLNEGIHIPRVDAVIMLRTTSSRIIYMQQLGRCLTAANSAKPVVLDMVDNLTGINAIHGIRDEYIRLMEESGKAKEIELHPFNIIDYIEDLRDVVDKLKENPYLNSFEKGLQLVKEYTQKYGRQPKKKDGYIHHIWMYLIKDYADNAEVIQLKKRYGFRQLADSEIEAQADEIISFIMNNKRLPKSSTGNEYEGILYHRLRNLRKYTYLQKVQELFDTIDRTAKYSTRICRKTKKNKSEEENVEDYISFCNKYHRLPRTSGRFPRESALCNFLNRKKDERLKKYPRLREVYNLYFSKNINTGNQYSKRNE